jgi:hypothetical protein
MRSLTKDQVSAPGHVDGHVRTPRGRNLEKILRKTGEINLRRKSAARDKFVKKTCANGSLSKVERER